MKDILGAIPQPPKWHQEGSVLAHTRLVRKALPEAIQALKAASLDPDSAFSNLDVGFDDRERILRLGALLHDLGKDTATTVGPLTGDEKPWKQVPNIDPETHELHAKRHEEPMHFNPAFRQLMQSKVWQDIIQNTSFEDQKDLAYIVRNHMKLRENFHGIIHRMVDKNGKFTNRRRTKLLLVLILADRRGRLGAENTSETIKEMQRVASKYARRFNQPKPASDDPKEFVKGIPRHRLPIALKGKFGREYSPEEIAELLS
jgi:hypothetical protein